MDGPERSRTHQKMLKNARTTYQKMVNKIFKYKMRRNIKAYIDDIIIKRKTVNTHITNLIEMFHEKVSNAF